MISKLRKKFCVSARARFKTYGTVIVVLICCCLIVICTQLVTISREADFIAKYSILNTRLLGETSDRISELRLSQAMIVLAPSVELAALVKEHSKKHRSVLSESEMAYVESNTPTSSPLRTAAFAAVNDYVKAEEAWETIHRPGEHFEGPLAQKTGELYEIADEAIDSLINQNVDTLNGITKEISDVSTMLCTLAIAVGLLVCGIKIWSMRTLDALLFRPLEEISDALSALSHGLEIDIPSTDRHDEIGRLAKAFEGFRANSYALRDAYTAKELAEEVAVHLARRDPLTGLYNRRHLTTWIDGLSKDHDLTSLNTYYLLVISLERFKPINDLYGDAAGDSILCAIASRLQSQVKDNDGPVARLSGDEFAFMIGLQGHDTKLKAIDVAKRVSYLLTMPIRLDATDVEVGVSIGLALYGRDGSNASTLLRAADAAMRRAKTEQPIGPQLFEEGMRQALRSQAELEVEVRNAVITHLIKPYYQPLVDLRTREIYGFEVLARWPDRRRGEIGPDVFIPIIDRLGLASSFTLYMLRQSCKDARQWPGNLTLAINVSPRLLADSLLPAQIQAVLKHEKFSPERLEIEMTESALVGDLKAARSAIDSFRRLGIRISLDDFGTGFSSLNHLRTLRIDKIKIDKLFVQSMLSDTESGKIVDAILKLSEALGLATLAEGIETKVVEDALRTRGCLYGQGYIFGKAIEASAVVNLLNGKRHVKDRSLSVGS